MARAQGAQAGAKEDTVYLALAGALTTDLAQQLTNLTASGAGAYEAPSARANLPTVRTVSVRWTATAAEVGVVLMLEANAAQTDIVWGLATEGAGKVCGYINGNVGVITATLPTAAKDYTISWSTRTNPDAGGNAAIAMLSELVIYNHTDSTVDDIVQATHAVSAAATGPYNLSVGGWWNGAALTSVPTNAIIEARVSVTHHPHTEELEDWAGARVAYAGTADDAPSEPVGPIPSSSGLGDESQIAGRHPWAYAAAHALGTRTRSWSTPLNEVDNDAEAMPTAQQEHWEAAAPGDSRYSLDLSRPRWLQVPPEATHVRVRVHARTWVTAGAAVPIHFRVYAWNRPPTLAAINAQNAPGLESYYGEGSVTLDDELGTGTWLDLGPVLLPRFDVAIPGWEGSVWLTLAYAIDPEGLSGNDAAARFDVDAAHAVPAVVSVAWQIVEL